MGSMVEISMWLGWSVTQLIRILTRIGFTSSEPHLYLMINWYHMHCVVSVCLVAFVDMCWCIGAYVYVIDVLMIAV